MKVNQKKLNKFVYRNRMWIAFTVTLLIVVAAGAIFTASRQPNLNAEVIATKPTVPAKSSAPSVVESVAPVPTPDSPMAQRSRASNSKPSVTDPPIPTSVQVVGVIAGGSDYCSNGHKISLSYAYISTNTYPGTVQWQIEARQNGVINIVGSGTAILPSNVGSYEIKNPRSYEATMTGDDTAIRLHVTSPNDVVSKWFTRDLIMRSGSAC